MYSETTDLMSLSGCDPFTIDIDCFELNMNQHNSCNEICTSQNEGTIAVQDLHVNMESLGL